MVLFLIAKHVKIKNKKIQKIFIFYFYCMMGITVSYQDCGAIIQKNKLPAGLEPATLRLPC